MMKGAIIIPARKNSKRLKGKNKKLLNGIPLIEYSLKYAVQFSDLDIIVSSDDKEILNIGKKYTNILELREDYLADDHTSILEVLKSISLKFDYDYYILLQPTNPLRPPDLINEAIALYNNNKLNVISISILKEKFGKLLNNSFEPINYSFGERSQDLKEDFFIEDGLIYLFSQSSIKSNQLLISPNNVIVTQKNFPLIDIDTIEDFLFAEFIIKNHGT